MSIDQWTVTSLMVDDVEMLADRCPAGFLTHEAQWRRYKNEDGEECSTFLGAEFAGNTGSKIRIAFEGPSDEIFNTMITHLSQRGARSIMGARAAPGPGVHEFTLREQGSFYLTVLVSPVPA